MVSVSVTRKKTKALKRRVPGVRRYTFGATVPFSRQTTLKLLGDMLSVSSKNAQRQDASTGRSMSSTTRPSAAHPSAAISTSSKLQEKDEFSLSESSMENDDSDLDTKPETTVARQTPTYQEMEIVSSEVRAATHSVSGPTAFTIGIRRPGTLAGNAGLVTSPGMSSSLSGSSSQLGQLPNFLAECMKSSQPSGHT